VALTWEHWEQNPPADGLRLCGPHLGMSG